MILSDKTIKEYIKNGKIIVKPELDLFNLRPTGIRVHLDDKILIPVPGQKVTIKSDVTPKYEEYNLKEKSYILKPNAFILAVTHEFIKTDKDMIVFLDGRSTLARLGLVVHLTSNTIDGVIDGQKIVYEIKNLGVFDVELKYKDPIGLAMFFKLTTQIENGAGAKYKDQNKVTVPNLKLLRN